MQGDAFSIMEDGGIAFPWILDVFVLSLGTASMQGDAFSSMEDGGIAFPWILDVFDIDPYDFIKVSESFIKAESSLSREIVKV